MTAIDHGSFAEALVVYARQEIARDQGLKAHPTPEKLAAYHADELSEAEDLEIQRHLAICSECPALLIDLEDLFEPRQRDLGLSDTGVASAWQDLRSRVGGKGTTGGPPVAAKTPWWAWFSAALKSPVLASGLAVLCVGLSVSVIQLRENQAAPVVNPMLVELRTESVRGDSQPSPPQRVQLPEQNDGFAFSVDLLPHNAERYEEFRVRILNSRGKEVDKFVSTLQEKDQDEDPILDKSRLRPGFLQRSALVPGVYTIQVFGMGAEDRKPLETFTIEVVHI